MLARHGKTLKDALDESGELWVENEAKTVFDVWFSMEEHHVPWETLEPHQVLPKKFAALTYNLPSSPDRSGHLLSKAISFLHVFSAAKVQRSS